MFRWKQYLEKRNERKTQQNLEKTCYDHLVVIFHLGFLLPIFLQKEESGEDVEINKKRTGERENGLKVGTITMDGEEIVTLNNVASLEFVPNTREGWLLVEILLRKTKAVLVEKYKARTKELEVHEQKNLETLGKIKL